METKITSELILFRHKLRSVPKQEQFEKSSFTYHIQN